MLLVQFICNFTEKLKVYISLFCLKSFFFKNESQPAGPITKTKKFNVE